MVTWLLYKEGAEANRKFQLEVSTRGTTALKHLGGGARVERGIDCGWRSVEEEAFSRPVRGEWCVGGGTASGWEGSKDCRGNLELPSGKDEHHPRHDDRA